MDPLINIILLIPLLLIVGTIVLIRIKGKLENKLFLYRHEGIILQTSLAILRMRTGTERRQVSLGLALLTGSRFIVFNWKQQSVFECVFPSPDNSACELNATDNKNVIVSCKCGAYPRELELKVRNPDAWKLEFSRLQSHESSPE